MTIDNSYRKKKNLSSCKFDIDWTKRANHHLTSVYDRPNVKNVVKPQFSLHRILFCSQLFTEVPRVCWPFTMFWCTDARLCYVWEYCCSLLQLKSVVKLWSGYENERWLSCLLLSVSRMLRPSRQKCCWSTSQAVYLLYQSWPSLEKKALWKKYHDIFILHLAFKNMSAPLCLYHRLRAY